MDPKPFKLKNGQNLIIRNPLASDAEALIKQMQQVDTETKFLAREPGEFNLTPEQERSFIESSNKSEVQNFLVAEVDGKIVGNCSVALVMTRSRFKHRAGLGIALLKDYWNLGIGKKLIQANIDWCIKNGLEQVELDVVATNQRALSLYKHLGFEVYGTKKNAMKYADGTYVDEIFMIKTL